MIFAEVDYLDDHWSFHEELKDFLHGHFLHMQSGGEGDSWSWIFDGGQKVSINTFS